MKKLGTAKVTSVGTWRITLDDGWVLMMDLLDPKSPKPSVGDTVSYYAEGFAIKRFEVVELAHK